MAAEQNHKRGHDDQRTEHVDGDVSGYEVAVHYIFPQPGFKAQKEEGEERKEKIQRCTADPPERQQEDEQDGQAGQGADQAVDVFRPGMEGVEDGIVVPGVGCPVVR